MTRDITAIAEVPFYTGFLSQLGIFFWVATATLCFFSSKFSSNNIAQTKLKKFLFYAGLLTVLLCIDDIFLLHETVFPKYFGVPQKLVILIYGFLFISLLVKFYTVILKTNFILLGMALFFFGLSVFFDLFPIPGVNPYLLDDGAKIIGIISWFFYFYSNAVSLAKTPKKA
ncbi:MAG: hypothetical protein BM564_01505 [Bacteroidetes bacterium MedPE-SWsnd-G2]|nr:MAG: hypothetical protein BM564_01505 [Bacteroidetes bacterium MedPE-SWsnd-G2]